MPTDARSAYLGATIMLAGSVRIGLHNSTRRISAERFKGKMDPSKKEPEMTVEQETIDRIIDELDVDVCILITADSKGVSMSSASKEEIGCVMANKWMAQISERVFKKNVLGRMKMANKIPV